MSRTAFFLVASLFICTSAEAADKPQEAPASLEKKLHGTWQGPACGGDWTYMADGRFEAQHYTPGNNLLSGTWEVHWNALPPTLVRTCKNSDDPELVGKTWEVKLIELNDAALAYQYPDQYPAGHTVRYTHIEATEESELSSIQGIWTPLQYEAEGKQVQGEFNFKQIIKGDQVTFRVNGETKAEGKVVVDATKNPKHLEFQFTSGQTDLIIYVRAGNYITYCGNRDGKTRPEEFATGTAKGGEYLQVWKVER